MTPASVLASAIVEACGGIRPLLFAHSDITGILRMPAVGSAGAALRCLNEGLLEAAGPGGTIMAPSFTYAFCKGEPFSLTKTPGAVGLFANYLMRQPGAVRSFHPIFSCVAQGARAQEICGIVSSCAFGKGSALSRAGEYGGWIVFIDAGFDRCTYVHSVEQELGIDYRYLKVFSGSADAGRGPVEYGATFFVRKLELDVENSFDRLEVDLLTSGEMKVTQVPDGPRILAVSCAALARQLKLGLAADPHYAASYKDTPPPL